MAARKPAETLEDAVTAFVEENSQNPIAHELDRVLREEGFCDAFQAMLGFQIGALTKRLGPARTKRLLSKLVTFIEQAV